MSAGGLARYDQQFEIAGLDLGKLASVSGENADTYNISGSLSAKGRLKGSGFTLDQTKTWNGGFDGDISGLVLEKSDRLGTVSNLLANSPQIPLPDVNDALDLRTIGTITSLRGKWEFEPVHFSATVKDGVLSLPQMAMQGKGRSAGLEVKGPRVPSSGRRRASPRRWSCGPPPCPRPSSRRCTYSKSPPLSARPS